jgi:hypothetical protein
VDGAVESDISAATPYNCIEGWAQVIPELHSNTVVDGLFGKKQCRSQISHVLSPASVDLKAHGLVCRLAKGRGGDQHTESGNQESLQVSSHHMVCNFSVKSDDRTNIEKESNKKTPFGNLIDFFTNA